MGAYRGHLKFSIRQPLDPSFLGSSHPFPGLAPRPSVSISRLLVCSLSKIHINLSMKIKAYLGPIFIHMLKNHGLFGVHTCHIIDIKSTHFQVKWLLNVKHIKLRPPQFYWNISIFIDSRPTLSIYYPIGWQSVVAYGGFGWCDKKTEDSADVIKIWPRKRRPYALRFVRGF